MAAGLEDVLIKVSSVASDMAEVGLDLAHFPTASHLGARAKLSPRTIQFGPKARSGPTAEGNRDLKRVLGEAATSAAKTDTFLGERYRRIAPRRGKAKGPPLLQYGPVHWDLDDPCPQS